MNEKLKSELDKTTLSIAEKQIVEGVVMGLSNEEIANQTFKSEQSIKLEFEIIKEKLNINTRAKVIVHYLGIIGF
jgi:DNA-binding NarL/FixJ family response regulator